MKHMQRARVMVAVCFLATALGILGFGPLRYGQALIGSTGAVRTITAATYTTDSEEYGTLALPHKLTGLEPRTAVTLFATIAANPGESLLVKSVFAPLRLYVNDAMLYEYGQEGSFPSYMNDPPTGLSIVKLPEGGGTLFLRVEYESLTQRTVLSLPKLSIGDNAALVENLFRMNGFSFLFSLILIFLGMAMVLISLIFIRKLPSGLSFLWLGLFSLSAGIWILGECDLAAFFLPYPSLLYNMAYMGLFCVTFPFLRFGLVVLNPQNRLPLHIMLWVHSVAVTAAVLLQLTGFMDFTRTLYWFHIITPLGFITFAVCLVWEHFRHHNPAARRFGPAILLLTASTVLELLNYWLHLIGTFTLFFQLGVLAFVISLGIISGDYVRESMRNAAERARLEYEMTAMERQLSLQRLQYQKMAENEEAAKAQRHDLRHQLVVLLSMTSDEQRLNEYIESLVERIPSGADVRLCENYAVNAIAVHYYSLARRAGISASVQLTVPRKLDVGIESDLCVMIGNLLENAVEACERIESGERFIRFNSGLEHDILTLTADNSCDGKLRKLNGEFLSSKRQGVGTGISSVAAVARKYGGSAQFQERNNVFEASVYLRIRSQEPS